jgi:hypothetical protein
VTWCESPTLGSLGSRTKVVRLEDVVAGLAAAAASSDKDSETVTELSRKYLLAVA